MPEKEALERARRDKTEGKSPSTQAGEFVRESRKALSRFARATARRRSASSRRASARKAARTLKRSAR